MSLIGRVLPGCFSALRVADTGGCRRARIPIHPGAHVSAPARIPIRSGAQGSARGARPLDARIRVSHMHAQGPPRVHK
ncbi:hypothetical protein GCM10027058_19090 [Microbacterium neimengense]